MSRALDKNKVDVSQAFLAYMTFVGDVERTAHALDLEPKQIQELAEAEGWQDKIRRVSLMSKSGKPGDFERATNRALCFVQAQVLRQQVNRLLTEVQAMTNEELLSRACVRTRDGGMQLSAKFLLDMAACAETCHRMTYAALGDTITERCEAEGGNGQKGPSSNDLHAAIIASLSNPDAQPEPVTQQLIAEANEEVQRRNAAQARDKTSANPLDPADSADD
jgi:hypothetical protein